MKKTVSCILFLSLFLCNASADCWGAPIADYCGLDLIVETQKPFYTPREPITFMFEIVNSSKNSVFIPASFFDYGLLPRMELTSGKKETFKAIHPAPECEKPPSERDIVLEAGNSFEFKITRPAYPEAGNQKWSYKGILYACPKIENSINCKIESNTIDLNVLDFSGWQTSERIFNRVVKGERTSAELIPYEKQFHKYFQTGSNSVLSYFVSSPEGVFWCGPKMSHPNPYSWLYLSVLIFEKSSFQIKIINTVGNFQETLEFQEIEPGPYLIKIENLTSQKEWGGRFQFNFNNRVVEELPFNYPGKK